MKLLGGSFGKKYVVIGIGKTAESFLCNTKLTIIGLYDSYRNGYRFYGLEVKDINSLRLEEETDILIASYADKEISKEIEKFGYKKWISIPYVLEIIEAEEKFLNYKIEKCMIEATSYCNAKCSFCNNFHMKRPKMHMNEEIFGKIIERLKEENIYPKEFRLHCCGEPLLDPNLFEKIKRIRFEFPESKIGFTTNFSVVNDEIITNILGIIDFITISINSLDEKEYYDLMKLDYKKTLSNIRKLSEEKHRINSKLPIEISICTHDVDSNVVTEFKSYWEEQGMVVRVMQQGSWLEGNAGGHTQLQGASIYKYCWTSTCPMIYQELCVLSNGDYAACCFDSEGSLGEMNIMEYTIQESMQSDSRKKFIKDNNICKDCSFRK